MIEVQPHRALAARLRGVQRWHVAERHGYKAPNHFYSIPSGRRVRLGSGGTEAYNVTHMHSFVVLDIRSLGSVGIDGITIKCGDGMG